MKGIWPGICVGDALVKLSVKDTDKEAITYQPRELIQTLNCYKLVQLYLISGVTSFIPPEDLA